MRLQLALNVTDIDQAVDFYGRLFGVEPHKRREGYANFEVADPPLKLVLFEQAEVGDRLNHLGVEVEGTGAVADALARLRDEGLDTRTEDATTCCHAVQDKVWVTDPDGSPWEVYAILDDDPDGRGLGATVPVAVGDPGLACAVDSPCCT